MAKEGQTQFGRSFIQDSELNQQTGVWTVKLDGRYSQKREGLSPETAFKMIHFDDIISAFGIKRGDRIDIKIKVKEADPVTGEMREAEKWQEPIDGERFKAVHEGKLIFSAPKGSNVPLEHPLEDIIHIRKHRRAKMTEVAPKKFYKRKDLSERAKKLGINPGDSFQLLEKIESKDTSTGKRVGKYEWRQVYGITYVLATKDKLVVRDDFPPRKDNYNGTRYLNRRIVDIRRAEALPYPFSDRTYLSQK